MPAPKIVFFDIDSTLYDANKTVPESTREAIKELQRKGVITAIATGRAPFMFAGLRDELSIDAYASFNGSFVVYADRPIYKRPLSETALRSLAEQSALRGIRMVFLNEETMKIDGKIRSEVAESISSLKLNLPMPEIDPDFYRNHEIYQSLLFLSEEEDSGYLRQPPLTAFRYVRWHEYSVDVIPRHGSKAHGILQLLKKLHLTPADACAFGDGYNDVEMLSYVGTGVAMGNAVDVAKKAADLVTRPVDQDGIYYGLKEIGLL